VARPQREDLGSGLCFIFSEINLKALSIEHSQGKRLLPRTMLLKLWEELEEV
jgi:hypothetical protein